MTEGTGLRLVLFAFWVCRKATRSKSVYKAQINIQWVFYRRKDYTRRNGACTKPYGIVWRLVCVVDLFGSRLRLKKGHKKSTGILEPVLNLSDEIEKFWCLFAPHLDTFFDYFVVKKRDCKCVILPVGMKVKCLAVSR